MTVLDTTAVSPFGPVRKNQPKPPVTIPGQRKPSSSIAPRPTPPRPLQANYDPKVWLDLAKQALGGDPIDCYANHCFTDGVA